MDKCIACGVCAEKCPKRVDDEFNMGVSKRKAAYIKYGQAVPLKYAIDGENCIYLTRGKCRACEKFCPTGAINFEDKGRQVDLQVGSVILAPGYKPFDPSDFDFYGYNTIPDVVTSLEYERLLSASGPFMGHLVKPSDHEEPKKIAWLQCVGSRNTNRCDNGYCSSVCCMYAIKQALVTAEHLDGNGLEQTVFCMDVRSHGKDFDRYYENARASGVNFLRARPHSIEPGAGGKGVNMRYATEAGAIVEETFDMAVLSVGLEAPEGCGQLAEIFDIDLDDHRFALTSSFDPVASSRPGIYVTGAFQAPKAIPRSVAEASAAATGAARMLAAAKGTLTREKTYPRELDISGDAARVGVFVCSCGINIAGVVDVEKVVDYARGLPNVCYVENNLFTCSADTQNIIAEKVREYRLNRIVVAACTPRTHEPLFQETLKEASLNAYMIEMANIRNQNAWVHQQMPEKATAKAMDQVRMAVAKVNLSTPLASQKVAVTQKALVIGGGVAGLHAARGLAGQGFETVLLEKSGRLGGNAWNLDTSAKGDPIEPMLTGLIESVEQDPRIEVLTNAALKSVTGSVGNFSSEIEAAGQVRTLAYGAAVLATGARESTPSEYLYGEDDRVMTHLAFGARLKQDPDTAAKARSTVFIQCVGSRDAQRPYCSRVCCTHTVKSAITLKTLNPDMDVFVLYRDMRTYGIWETLYKQARDLGVLFVRYTPESKPVVTREDADLWVGIIDPVIQMPLKIHADYLVLAAAIEPSENEKLIELFKCGVDEDGFLNEAHPKLRPVDMSVDGLFLAGMCSYPKPVDEAIGQAEAAVARAGVILSREEMKLDAIKSFVTEDCDGCALCLDVCPYNAIKLETMADKGGQSRSRVTTDAALCKGCGLCTATCPKGAINVHGFTMEQLKAQVTAALEAVNF